VDDSIAPLNPSLFRNLTWQGNTYNNIDNRAFNPATITLEELTPAQTWTGDFIAHLPFGGKARRVLSVMAENKIKNGSNTGIYTQPYAVTKQGVTGAEIVLHWSEAVKGKVNVTVRADNPV